MQLEVTWNKSKKKVLMGGWENKLQNLQISQNEILHMMILPVFSQFLRNLKFIFSDSHTNRFFVVILSNLSQVTKNAV